MAAMFLLSLVVAGLTSCAAGPSSRPHTLEVFQHRRALADRNSAVIIRAAEAAADRVAANPQALINVPYDGQEGFAEEHINRAGGLANALPPDYREGELTTSDVALLSVRSWASDQVQVRANIDPLRGSGSMIVLFASPAGLPPDLPADHLTHNHAPSRRAEHAADNVIANTLNSWLWVCEYSAALTRRGKHPGILLSILLPSADAFDRRMQGSREGRKFLGDCSTAIEPGALSRQFLQRVDELILSLRSPRTRSQLEHAAELIHHRLASGNTVAVTTNTHILMSEIFENPRTAMKPFRCVGDARRAFAANVGAGDIVLWIAYVGMNTPYEDYAGAMRRTGADLITCFVPDRDPTNNAPDAIAHIDQAWMSPDAVVDVPFPPGRIAPISGLNEALLYRMLEDAVVAKSASADLVPARASAR